MASDKYLALLSPLFEDRSSAALFGIVRVLGLGGGHDEALQSTAIFRERQT
jgi:hypothetical protein